MANLRPECNVALHAAQSSTPDAFLLPALARCLNSVVCIGFFQTLKLAGLVDAMRGPLSDLMNDGTIDKVLKEHQAADNSGQEASPTCLVRYLPYQHYSMLTPIV